MLSVGSMPGPTDVDGVAAGVGVAEGAADGVVLGMADGVALGVAEGLAEGVAAGVGVGTTGVRVFRPVEVSMPQRAASAGL